MNAKNTTIGLLAVGLLGIVGLYAADAFGIQIGDDLRGLLASAGNLFVATAVGGTIGWRVGRSAGANSAK